MKHMRQSFSKDRKELDVTGLDEEQAKEAQKKDYEEKKKHHGRKPDPRYRSQDV